MAPQKNAIGSFDRKEIDTESGVIFVPNKGARCRIGTFV